MLTSVLLMAGAGIPPSDKTVEIAPGVYMPKINLGTCCGSQPKVGLDSWLEAGGVGIDTAYDYRDQTDIATVLAAQSTKREDLFILSKVPAGLGIWPSDCSGGAATALKYVNDDLKQLNTTYVDIVILHAPCKTDADNQGLWAGLEQALSQGLTRAIGISNYKQADIEGLLKTAKVKPALNQCQMSVQSHDDATIAYCQSQNITYEAFDAMKGCLWNSAAVLDAAKAHSVSAAQVCLRYILDRGAVMAVGTGSNASTVAEYAKENLGTYDFQLTAAEVTALNNAANN